MEMLCPVHAATASFLHNSFLSPILYLSALGSDKLVFISLIMIVEVLVRFLSDSFVHHLYFDLLLTLDTSLL